jgi:8-amino-7-oxononanoate synthase
MAAKLVQWCFHPFISLIFVFKTFSLPEDFLIEKLNERQQQHALRELKIPQLPIDFCSNDYLGIVKNRLLSNDQLQHLKSGSTGSRLLSGNYEMIEECEQLIAGFHEAEAGLIFNSGYDANIGLLSCIARRGDSIIYDHLSHASIRDGIRLSFASSFSFNHNDIKDLEKKLQTAPGNRFVVTESVFSMDGDKAPLNEITALCERYKANLIIDEAHATGVIGDKGEGLAQVLRLHQQCFARVHTFGKAIGCHGAIVLGSKDLRNYLLNFSRPFIYSTAMPEASVYHIQASYKIFPDLKEERKKLHSLIQIFQESKLKHEKLVSNTPIQGIIVPGNEHVKTVAAKLHQNGFDVRPILYPTVPAGSERLRIVLHSFNTTDELHQLLSLLS